MPPSGRKRKAKDISSAPTIALKPLLGAQIEALTKTHNDLRAAGVNSVIQLPATVVAGDTSSGKSSVMWRLTGLPFPRGEGVVTRFATEVDMMPQNTEHIRVTIRADKSRPAEQQESLERFQRTIELAQFEETFRDACALMSRHSGRTLYGDILHIDLKGPNCRPLTVIDLPGLIHAATQKVSDADRKLSEELAKRYIRQDRTIVLAVLSASNDAVNQVITRITREHDKQGERTLGIVSKVDTVCGKAKDNQLFNILSNEEIPLKLGWHALVNTIEEDENATDDQITQAEIEFFQSPRFNKVDKSTTGIDNLRERVVRVVGEKLVTTLPNLRHDVCKKLSEMKAQQAQLGDPVSDLIPQRKLLMQICNRFQRDVQAQITGSYSTEVLMQATDISSAARQSTLRADIDTLHHDFASAMEALGGTKKFHGLGPSSYHTVQSGNAYSDWAREAGKADRAEAIRWVTGAQESSARSGMSGDQVVESLFRELSSRWGKLAREHIEVIVSTCKETIGRMLDRGTSYQESVADQIEAIWIHPHLDAKLAEVESTLTDLEVDVMTTLKCYNPRLEAVREQKLQEYYSIDEPANRDPSSKRMAAIANLMSVLAHYEVNLEYWTTAVLKQVAERFVRCIPDALSAELVLEMSDEQIQEVMTEGHALADERKKLKSDVDTLEFALVKLDAQLKCLRQ